MAEGRAGGVGSRGVGGGFDGNPGGPSRDGANDDHDPMDRNRPRQRSQTRMKLPAEYADFKLADGRTLRDVMGDKFFGAVGKSGGGKWMSKGVRERLRQGGGPFRGDMFGKFGAGRLARLRARAEAQRAERQARLDERRARAEARRASHPGGNFTFGGRL